MAAAPVINIDRRQGDGWAAAATGDATQAFIVDLDGFGGPLDLLLALARSEKLDLRAISIQALADQYLAYIARVRRANLEVAAEYLVMAAWLAYLKSRLLLPAPPDSDEPSAEALAEALARQLRRLELIRALGARLMARPQRGIDVFPRGCPEPLQAPVRLSIQADLYDLLAAYGRHVCRQRQQQPLALPEFDLDRVEDAMGRMLAALGQAPGWENLSRFLPEGTLEGLRLGRLRARSALASTLIASLELARRGRLAVRQARPFGPIALLALAPTGESNADADLDDFAADPDPRADPVGDAGG